eukprot:tig00000663_g2983.t1
MERTERLLIRLRAVFEGHRTPLTVAGSTLSICAAIAGYKTKIGHEERLHRRLDEINQRIEAGALQAKEAEKYSDFGASLRYGPLAFITCMAAGYVVGLRRGRFGKT